MLVGAVALGLGIVIAAVTLASQIGLLGGHDFALVALFGLMGTVVAVVALLTKRERHRALAAVGLALSSVPVILLVYYLGTSDG